MLELQNICYRVSTPEGEQDILKNVSITIPDHKLVVFTGPNGGGKTTLAKVIMGLVQPTSGRVLYNGEDVTDLSITERAKRGISYGFQQPPRFKGITVHDLLLLAAGTSSARTSAAPILPRLASAPTTTWTARWTCLCPAARSSASRSPPSWPAAAS